MVAKTLKNQKGQSILEVIFVLPVLFLFVNLLYKVNMAAQMAIVNEQYARAQMFTLTANSSNYPRLDRTYYSNTVFSGNSQDRLITGVADPAALGSQSNDSQMSPIPQVQKIARSATQVRGSMEAGEPTLRNEIRVRNTSAICTQINAISKGVPLTSKNINEKLAGDARWPFGLEVCQYNGKAGN